LEFHTRTPPDFSFLAFVPLTSKVNNEMAELQFTIHKPWHDLALDGFELCRDSLMEGRKFAEQLQFSAQSCEQDGLTHAAICIFVFADYFDENLVQAELNLLDLEHRLTEENDGMGLRLVHFMLAIVWRKMGYSERAFQLCEKNLLPTVKDNASRLSVLILNIVGVFLQEAGRFEDALSYFFVALDHAKKIQSHDRMAQVMANLGEALFLHGCFEEAETVLLNSQQLALQSKEKWLVPFNSTMLSLCYIGLGKYELAYETISLHLHNVSNQVIENSSYSSFYFAVAAYSYSLRGDMQTALQFIQKAIIRIDSVGDINLRPYVFYVSALISRSQDFIDEAICQLESAIDQKNGVETSYFSMLAVSELAELYATQKRWELAYVQQKRYHDLLVQFETKSKRNQLSYLKFNNQLKEAELKRITTEKLSVQKKRLDDELERMLKERETILESSIVGMILLDVDGRVQWVNTPLCQMFGADRKDVLGSTIEAFYESRESYLASSFAVADAVERGEVYRSELQMRKLDGSLFWVQFSGRAVHDSDVSLGTVWVVMDISERRQLEEELYKSEHNYRLLINNVTEGIVVVKDGKIAFANALILKMTGYSLPELMQVSFLEPVHTDDVATVLDRHTRRLRGENVEQYYQVRLQHKLTRDLVWVEVSSVVIEWEGGAATLSFISDLTQRKHLESRLKESMDEQMRLQKLQMQNEIRVAEMARQHAEETTKAKSMFLANMSHEIRTPMNAIIGMAHLALKTELNLKQRDYLDKIHRAGVSLMGIINDILDFSKIEAGKLDIETVDFYLDDVLDSLAVVTREKAQEKNLEYIFDVDPHVPRFLKGDPLRLGQVLINLANNAIKFTEQGYVRIVCSLEAQVAQRLQLKFAVIDTGLGMTQEQAAHLFQAFSQGDGSTTRRYGGTGLGLSISKGMVELMGGAIALKSDVNLGTCVEFSIWLESNQPYKEADSSEVIVAHVLIVDDNPYSAQALQRELQYFSITSDVIGQCSEVISRLEESAQLYRAIFIDSEMRPIDGIELMTSLKRRLLVSKQQKLILMGAASFAQSHPFNEKEVMATPDYYLEKPFTRKQIQHCLGSLFHISHQSLFTNSPNSVFHCENLRILLVEDNPVNQQIACELLDIAGAKVEVVNNGKSAVERVFSQAVDHYGMVFMDIQMPEMDGVEATQVIRSNDKFSDLPIVAMTAHALLSERQRCLTAGMNEHIAKPIDPHVLYRMVEQFCPKHCSYIRDQNTQLKELPRYESIPLNGVDMKQGLNRTLHDHNLYLKLLEMFVHDQRSSVTDAHMLIARGDFLCAQRKMHTLRGVAGLIGADIAQDAERIERLIADKSELKQIEAQLYVCEKRMFELIQSIELYLEQHQVEQRPQFESIQNPDLNISQIEKTLNDCFQLLENYESDAIDLLAESRHALTVAFGHEVQKQIMRAASQYDFDGVLNLFKASALNSGIRLEM
jgi:two-component system sensor histidine kinase/response regulator